ncbi:Heat shock chaperone IbpA [Candidatus Hepatincolaceae symbiont of Richtersius coronifer]
MKNQLRHIGNNNGGFSLINDFFNRDFFSDFFNKDIVDHSLLNNMYGKHNVEKISDDIYRISVNVAGYKKDEIEISLEKGLLKIRGQIRQENNDKKYIYQGFAASFSNAFSVGEDAEVLEAKIDNGILSIDVKEKLPIEHKPQKILIK